MNATTIENRKRVRTSRTKLGTALLLAALSGCSDGDDLVRIPGGDVVGPATPAAAKDAVLFEDFQRDEALWDVMAGSWEVRGSGLDERSYSPTGREFSLAVAGPTNLKDHQVQAQVVIQDDRFGHVGIVGHAQWDHYYYELLLGRDDKGVKSWFLRARQSHRWATLASGPVDYQYDTAYTLRLGFHGQELRAALSRDGGRSFDQLGSANGLEGALVHGRVGLVSYGGTASFDDFTVLGSEVLFSQSAPWRPIWMIRDTPDPGEPALPSSPPTGGWYVTPIHAVVRPQDGKVLIVGFGRRDPYKCNEMNNGHREVGETWLLDPADIDTTAGGTLQVRHLDEQNLAFNNDVLYCAGHNVMADGRIFLSAGTKYANSGGLPDTGNELGIKYSRIYDPATNVITRISEVMTGGASGAGLGVKWYPTNLLMPDGKILIYGGFHFSTGGITGAPKNNDSLETFDPSAPVGQQYKVLTQHGNGGQPELSPVRGYTTLFLLPRPVPAASAGNLARSVLVSGGKGKVFLFNHEPGPSSGGARLHAKVNALNPINTGDNRGYGSSPVMLSNGIVMFANGGHTGPGAAKAYFYDPYNNPGTSTTAGWSSLDLGITRLFPDAVHLPNGEVLIINGYNNNTTYQGPDDTTPKPDIEPGNTGTGELSGTISGDARRPQLVNPYASPRTKTDLGKWPEDFHRGYHTIAVLLKDGRILVGGGKDKDHDTGCEKNDIRIYEPPYLFAGPRPTITSPAEHAHMTVGGAPVTISYTGTVRADRGVVLMAPGALTHSVDEGQRYVPLTVVSGPVDGQVTVLPPPNINVAQPGHYLLFAISDVGAPSTTGVHVILDPPAPRTYTIAGNTYVEAECSSRRSGPWDLVSDAARSEGEYIEVHPGSGNFQASNAIDEGRVMWYDLDVTMTGAGLYNIWALTQGPTTSDDSFWFSIDGGPDTQLTPTATWGWVKLGGTATFNLSQGKHQLKVKVREDGSRIDKIYLSKSTTAPTGNGLLAQIQCNSTPCTAPAAPAPVTASSPASCQAEVSWANVSGEDGYRIRRDGVLLPGTIAANTTTFVDTTASDGSHTYEVQAFQGSCNSAFAAAPAMTVTAHPAPATLTVTPGNCQAMLSWPDVTGETGYRIRRNGATLPASIAANQTSFTDSPLTAANYNYEIQAFQGACNSAFTPTIPATATVSCMATGPSISNLVVNDTASTNPPAGSDLIPNAQQWSIRTNFGVPAGHQTHGDRTNTLPQLTGTAQTRLQGKPWIRTAADSKNYTPTNPPLATFTLTGGTVVSLGVDSRHATAFLTNNGWANQGFSFTILESGTTARTYNVWSKTFPGGGTVTLPTIGATTAPCYIVIAE